ncbi:MAG: glycosyltransferase family 39 protein [Crocinitomicaceae bacterium]
MKSFLKKLDAHSNLMFAAILVGLFFFLGQTAYFFSGPTGTHFFRQADSLSFVSGYFKNGYHFFEPSLLNLKSIDGKAASEFPLIYFFTALLFPVFGAHFFLLKLIHLLICYTGVFYFFRLVKFLLKDSFYAGIISLFIFTSTVFNYYSFNYLPDSAALGFVLIGWYFIFQFKETGFKKQALISILFFTLGGLTKIPFAISLLTIFVTGLLILILNKRDTTVFSKAKFSVFILFVGVLAIVFWNGYMLFYNEIYASNAFISKSYPIWGMTRESISIVWLHIHDFWYTRYLAHSSYHLLYAMLFLQLFLFRKANRLLSFLVILLFLGTLSFSLLFFHQFQDHDYYALVAIPFLLFLLVNAILTLQRKTNNKWIHWSVKLLFSIIVIAGINYSRMKLPSSYLATGDSHYQASKIILAHSNEISNLKIPRSSKIIIGTDESLNGGLLFMDRKGWTLTKFDELTNDYLTEKIKKGADYFILTKNDEAYQEILHKRGEVVLNKPDLIVYQLK